MQIIYNYISYCIGNKLNIISFIIHVEHRTVLVSHSNLACTFASTQVNATDISAHCDTMSQKRSLNPLYTSILNTISGVDSSQYSLQHG